MPTGYTAPLYEDKPISFEQFVLRCSRAMGAAIMQRDESTDVEIRLREVSSYEERSVVTAGHELAQALALTDEEWAAKQEAAIDAAVAYQVQYLSEGKVLYERYLAMYSQVLSWTPPTEEHDGLKKFMLEQLDSSITHDTPFRREPFEVTYLPAVPVRVSVQAYKDAEIARRQQALDRATERLREEYDRVRGQNEWVNALRTSLGLEALVPA